MRDFRQLQVWEQSHQLTLKIYQLTKCFPKEELYSLTNQIRRSCSSIPTNIAEGRGRGSNKEFAHFLQIAVGSAYELDYQILLAKDLQYIDNVSYLELSNEVSRLQRQILALLQKVRAAS
jgi:four helix bundle protein